MIRVIVTYGPPQDRAAFDAHYKSTHTPLTTAMPHLASFEVSQTDVTTSDEANPVYLTAILSFQSQADMEASMASPEGQAAVDDLANFATGGVTVLTVDMNKHL
ncbi:MAG: EthD family reductase [Alphaproteobacteria bacterium]|nr:EthD family reductase [Alphaproteobacteria bacterium]